MIQSKVFEKAIKIRGDTIEDMHIEIEQKDNKTEFLETKLGLKIVKFLSKRIN